MESMDDAQEPAELAGQDHPREDKDPLQEDAIDAHVAETEENHAAVHEDMDSRTSLAGRKRNLQELDNGDEADDDEGTDERLRKRVKDHQDPPLVGDLEPSITSIPVEVSSLAQAEADTGDQPSAIEPSVFKILQEESERSQVPGAESQSLFSLVGRDTETPSTGSKQTVSMPSSSWNGGLSTGLRTSFTGKARSTFGLRTPTTPEDGLKDTAAPAGPVAGSSAASSVLSTHANSPVVSISGELGEEQNIDDQDKRLHLKSIFDQFREPACSKVEMPPNGYETDSTGEQCRDAAPGGNHSANLSTEGQNEDVPFKKLKQAAIARLSPEDRAKYKAAARRAKKEGRRALKSRKEAASITKESGSSTRYHSLEGEVSNKYTATQDEGEHENGETDTAMVTGQAGLNQPTPFVKLSKKQVRLLSVEQLEEYNRSIAIQLAQLRLEKKAKVAADLIERFQKASDEVSAAFANSNPSQNISNKLMAMVRSGKTYYSRKLSPLPEYRNKNGCWKLYEMLSTDGKPFQIHEFSFSKFAPNFLSLYESDWNLMSQKVLTAAFHIYLRNYYSHVLNVGSAFESCRASASASDAITIQDAKALANKLVHSSNSTQKNQSALQIAQPTFVNTLHPEPSTQHVNNATDTVMDDANGLGSSNSGNDIALTSAADADEEPIDLDVQQAEMYLQQRYYPSSDRNVLRCLACSKTGHNTLECPLMKCSICHTSGIHSEAMCPQKKRCEKCRERGHKTEACKEKLSLPKSEMSCDICHSTTHLETACHFVWRSFDPRPEEIYTVQNIPVECYTCGYSGHFGPECGLYRGTILSGGITWSKHNLIMYVDSSSNSRALSAGKDYSIPAKGLNKGNAKDPITIDDESDAEPFIRPKVLPSHPKGRKIQVHPVQQNQQLRTQNGKKKNQNKEPEPVFRRTPNPPRASRPDFSSFRHTAQNPPPSAPRSGTLHHSGNPNQGGRGTGGSGGAGMSRAERRRMADQAGARGAHPGGF